MKYVSTERLTEIAQEVMNLIDPTDIFAFLDGNVGNMTAVELRLQEVLMTRQSFECIELAMFLRTCGTFEQHLPTWQPLLNAAIEQAVMRDEPINDIFFGLLPIGAHPQRNTGGPQKSLRPKNPVQQKRPS